MNVFKKLKQNLINATLATSSMDKTLANNIDNDESNEKIKKVQTVQDDSLLGDLASGVESEQVKKLRKMMYSTLRYLEHNYDTNIDFRNKVAQEFNKQLIDETPEYQELTYLIDKLELERYDENGNERPNYKYRKDSLEKRLDRLVNGNTKKDGDKKYEINYKTDNRIELTVQCKDSHKITGEIIRNINVNVNRQFPVNGNHMLEKFSDYVIVEMDENEKRYLTFIYNKEFNQKSGNYIIKTPKSLASLNSFKEITNVVLEHRFTDYHYRLMYMEHDNNSYETINTIKFAAVLEKTVDLE